MMKVLENLKGNSEKLKQLIAEHPDYPIIVMASDDVNNGDYQWALAGNVTFSVAEILNAYQDVDEERIYTDRDEFVVELSEHIYDIMTAELDDAEPSEEAVDERIAAELKRYEPYWEKVIMIEADC